MKEPKPWERQKTDTTKSWEAFCIYRDMGKERSLVKVAEKLSKSDTLLYRWSSQHDWAERVGEWDAEQDRIICAKLKKEIGSMRKRHADLATEMLVKAAKALERIPDYEIKASDISKMVETATKLERLSRGDTSEVVEERDGGAAVDPVQFYIPDNGRDGE